MPLKKSRRNTSRRLRKAVLMLLVAAAKQKPKNEPKMLDLKNIHQLAALDSL
jgi:hypothetical protein